MIRYEFTDASIREKDIHPGYIFDKEREMAKEFVGRIGTFERMDDCPICGAPKKEILFQKWGCRYAICSETWSVSLATLPEDEILQAYFRNSELSKFRASREYQKKVSERRKDLWESQVGWIEGRVRRHLGNERYVAFDWGAKFVGWIEFLNNASFVGSLMVKEPLPPITESSDIEGKADIILLIDVIQREAQPQKLLKRIAQKLKIGGLLIVTCRAGSGFDVLTLRENSENIFPLDHILLPSPKGMNFLLEQAGFDVLELTTPGLMDVTYVKNAARNIPKNQYFQRYIIEQGDVSLLERMQGFIQRNNLSSHLRCIARKVD